MKTIPNQRTNSTPFGMLVQESVFTAEEYRFGFNGKEKYNEVSGVGNTIAFEERIYDSRLGRFLSMDKIGAKYPYHSPYSFAGNNPIAAIDVQGDSLYILFYVTGSSDRADDEMFFASTLTRKTDIERSGHFDSKRDKVVVIGVSDISDIKAQTEQAVKDYSKTYGSTVEIGIWSHAGFDGPAGSESSTLAPLTEGGIETFQMTLEGWSNIEFNWENNGNGCRAGFYGCNTGVDPKGDKASFSTEISDLINFENVTVFGQTGSSFPSKYTNARVNSENGSGNFVNGTKNGLVSFYRTYLVGGVNRSHDLNGNEQNKALPMRQSKNGVGKVGGYQNGDQK